MKRVKPTEHPLVLIDTKTNHYKRYVGHECTDHMISDTALDADVVEQFRTAPESVYDDDEENSCA